MKFKVIVFLAVLILSIIEIQPVYCDPDVAVHFEVPIKQTGKKTLLVCIPASNVPYIQYLPVCRAIRDSNKRVWLAVLEFPNNIVTANGIGKGFDIAISSAKQTGFNRIINKDVFSWGHSDGGFLAGEVVSSNMFGGHMIFGGYLPNSTLQNFPIPVLTVGGSLDGITQVTRIAEEYRVTQGLLKQGKVQEAVSRKPVIVIEGMNHAQMCHNYKGGVIGANDFKPEITLTRAQRLIVKLSQHFIRLHTRKQLNVGLQNVFDFIYERLNTTEVIVGGFLQAQDQDVSYWCEMTQKLLVNLTNPSLLQVSNVYETNVNDFILSKPNFTVIDGQAYVVTRSYSNFTSYPSIVSVSGKYPYESNCKCKSSDFIIAKLGQVGQGASGTCQTKNLAVMEWALSAVSPKALSRYLSKGIQLNILPDVQYAQGNYWVESHLVFDTSKNPVDVAASNLWSPNIPTPFGGMTYCKGLPASKTIAWILHDSLPRGL